MLRSFLRIRCAWPYIKVFVYLNSDYRIFKDSEKHNTDKENITKLCSRDKYVNIKDRADERTRAGVKNNKFGMLGKKIVSIDQSNCSDCWLESSSHRRRKTSNPVYFAKKQMRLSSFTRLLRSSSIWKSMMFSSICKNIEVLFNLSSCCV